MDGGVRFVSIGVLCARGSVIESRTLQNMRDGGGFRRLATTNVPVTSYRRRNNALSLSVGSLLPGGQGRISHTDVFYNHRIANLQSSNIAVHVTYWRNEFHTTTQYIGHQKKFS